MQPRRENFMLALAGAIATAGLALAQNVPPQFVVTGKAAEKIQDYSTINLATAQRIAETCESLVVAHNGAHTIMVLDRDGNHVYADRMDGQGYTNVITAEWKARTAYLTRQPSKAVMNRVARDFNQEAYEVQLDRYPVAGGLPIVVNNQIIGFVGAGGYRPNPPVWSDEICVHTAMVQIFGPSVPPLLEDLKEEPPPRRGNAPVPAFGTTTPPKSSLPPEFVVTGAGAAHVFEGTQISLAAAKKIGMACRNWAASKGAAMSLYVIDNAGELVHMERMDGQIGSDVHTALLKARTALKLREPTSIRGTQMRNTARDVPRSLSPDLFHFFLDSGGIPIVVDSQMIGAVGVSGVGPSDAEKDAGRNDENCAVEGLKAAFGDHVIVPVYGASGRGR
jgi:glc operon protein GlcG